MPITFTIDQPHHAVLATAAGIVSADEVLGHVQAKAEVGAAGYDELFDARHVTLDLSSTDLIFIAKAVRETLRDETPGKSAVVTDSPVIFTLAKTYADLTGKEASDLQVFKDIEDARRWLIRDVTASELS